MGKGCLSGNNEARDVISGLLCGWVKCIAVNGEITSACFQSVARHAQYRIFLFRERSVKLKSSACLPVLVRSRRDEQVVRRLKSDSTMSASTPVTGAVLTEPYTKHTAATLRWWLTTDLTTSCCF